MVLLFEPGNGDARVVPASSDGQIRALVDGGLTIGDAVVPKTAPPEAGRILRFGPDLPAVE